MVERDAHTEPANSTVENWMGQEVSRDEELADRLMDEADGDVEAAEARFEEESAGARPGEGEVPRAGGTGHV